MTQRSPSPASTVDVAPCPLYLGAADAHCDGEGWVQVTFKNIFFAIFLGSAMIVAAFVVNNKRPEGEVTLRSAAEVRATGKCAECHRRETSAVVHQFETSRHAAINVSCFSCHAPQEGQQTKTHSGFTLTAKVTAKNCAQCHATEYDQFLKSRHAAPAWAAVTGAEGFSDEQIAFAEKYHPGTIERAPNALAIAEGDGVLTNGCQGCHSVGKPNEDGSIGSCTSCHARHSTSVELARQPETCGQCHMGPDHSQLEIFEASKHGALYSMLRPKMNLSASAKTLTTKDMPVPTCATCHMSGLEGMNVTHNVTERLSWWLFAPISKKRPNYQIGQDAMQSVCLKCHAKSQIDTFYSDAEIVVESTNKKVQTALEIVKELREEGLLTPTPFDEPIEFLAFDLWHYFGRTAKHGAFMGGADFVQWHGNYELLLKTIELKEMAKELRAH